MAWVRDDDRADDTRAVKRAWRRSRAAVGLHAMAKTYSARHRLDGLVDLEFLEDKLPKDREREEVVGVLVDVGLWELLPAGETRRREVVRENDEVVAVDYGPCDEDTYIVVEFLELNPSAEEQERKQQRLREARSAAGRKGAAKRWGRKQADGSSHGNSDGKSHSSSDGDDMAAANSTNSSRPDPTRPVLKPPSPPRGGRRRDRAAHRQEMAVWASKAVPTPDEAARAEAIVEQLRAKVDPVGFNTYLADLHAHYSGNGHLLLGTSVAASWVESRYSELIDNAIPDGMPWQLIECGCEADQ